eukprot:m.259761 g.259761  ORF g.259761 m.259761 type:complete len:60 (+) comp16207_c0_seq7:147-326(+)
MPLYNSITKQSSMFVVVVVVSSYCCCLLFGCWSMLIIMTFRYKFHACLLVLSAAVVALV